jgi:hypothetical protein
MRRLISFVFCAILFPTCYFLLLDYVRPILEQGALRFAWWMILGAFLTALFAFQFGADTIKRPKFFALGFLFLCGAVYSYDPSLNPYLAVVGLKWLWVPLLLGLLGWLYAYSRIETRQ